MTINILIGTFKINKRIYMHLDHNDLHTSLRSVFDAEYAICVCVGRVRRFLGASNLQKRLQFAYLYLLAFELAIVLTFARAVHKLKVDTDVGMDAREVSQMVVSTKSSQLVLRLE